MTLKKILGGLTLSIISIFTLIVMESTTLKKMQILEETGMYTEEKIFINKIMCLLVGHICNVIFLSGSIWMVSDEIYRSYSDDRASSSESDTIQTNV